MTAQTFSIDAGILCEAVNKTYFACDHDTVRATRMSALQIVPGAETTIVGVDGKRLAIYYAPEIVTETDEPLSPVLIPHRVANKIQGVFKNSQNVEITSSGSGISLQDPDMLETNLHCRPPSLAFPNYTQVLNHTSVLYRFIVDREAFRSAVDDISQSAIPPHYVLRLQLDADLLMVEARSAPALRPVEVENPWGQTLTFGFSAKYLRDAIHQHEDERLEIAFASSTSFIVIKSTETACPYFSVLMPIDLETKDD